MYETTVGDSNPAKKLCKHVASEYDVHRIRKQISNYETYIKYLREDRMQDESLGTDNYEGMTAVKLRREIKKDITRMRTWLRQNHPDK